MLQTASTSTTVAHLRIAVLAIFAIAWAAGPATAGADKAKSKITLEKLRSSGASGTVTSQDNDCLSGRKVTLFRLDGYLSVKVKITESDSQGTWRVKHDLEDGKYFAKVDASKVGSTTCLYAVSKTGRL